MASKKPTAKQDEEKNLPEDDGIHPAARPFLWLGNHFVVKNFMWLVFVLMLVFMAFDLFVHREGHFAFETKFAFYAFFGFFSFAGVVLAGWPLRWLTGRPENYYGDEEEGAE